ncbi:flagellar motor switch protein FliN [Cellulomonas fimi]|uniref:Flagellar motor switch protein FliN n=1 Tax=Cellulomonas fimi (strain ATCC 484 / DSM 20113 / JCM 1341 / CCUG 24087 / LMG 16345 / NBRC 15513 / NCIMB 8980 / NCTC 7547 / NRS-133) TaxID=590998 RepID=F4GYV9_CELFA|nr:flagellar motor switch protein FliN [Cellulomonas fimi]AEE44828.1 flagellar motor switch protein FliN [Cellulomonas fimi ATCC 484]NNH08357.1 flagellar motor switch protein FliN [Cellulomonas fimi]VEH27409.1 Flagellar motor switch protein FliN [Cellulomonas fimi]
MTQTPATGAPVAQAAADAAAALVPSALPLAAVAASHRDVPAGATALVASFVGSPSAELVLVAGAAVTDAVAASAVPLDLADALRPALEAAARTLGAGVLETVRAEAVAEVLADDVDVLALRADGAEEPAAWFALRLRSPKVATPTTSQVPTPRANLRMLYDVEMTLTAEIGRTRLPVRQVLDLAPGAVLELDRTAGSPADVLVNGRLVARGEVVVVDEVYGIRVTEIVAGNDAGGSVG